MFKKYLLLGAVSGILAGIACIIYQKIYSSSLGADFPGIVKPLNILLITMVSGLIASMGYWLLNKWARHWGEIIFNVVFVVLSFSSMLPAFAFRLPFDVDSPELFPGLVVPMHFFPALAWFALKPLFKEQKATFIKVSA